MPSGNCLLNVNCAIQLLKPLRTVWGQGAIGCLPHVGYLCQATQLYVSAQATVGLRRTIPVCLSFLHSWGGKWVIPTTATNDYYLSGTFSSMSPTNETRPRVW